MTALLATLIVALGALGVLTLLLSRDNQPAAPSFCTDLQPGCDDKCARYECICAVADENEAL